MYVRQVNERQDANVNGIATERATQNEQVREGVQCGMVVNGA